MLEIDITTFIKSYWNYYIELEKQLLATKKYVDFDKSNYKTFSIEYMKLFQAVCSEIDVVGKIIAEYQDSDFSCINNKNIQKWGFRVQLAFPDIETTTISVFTDTTIMPWKKWEYETYYNKNHTLQYRLKAGKKTPQWWTAYNKVKHERTTPYQKTKTNYCLANLENLILSMGALYILEMKFIALLSESSTISVPCTQSKLFSTP